MALGILDILQKLEKLQITVNISDILQKLEKLQAEAAVSAERQKEIEIQPLYLSPISKETFEFLEEKNQQELAVLIGKIYLGPPLSAKEVEKMRALIQCAEKKQDELYFAEGSKWMQDRQGDALISQEAFKLLKPDFQKQLLKLVGKQSLEKTLSQQDERALKDLVQLAQLKQANVANAHAAFLSTASSASANENVPSSLIYRNLRVLKKSK